MAATAVKTDTTGKSALLPPRRQQLDDLFALIDTDRSGTIEYRELVAMVRLVRPDAKDEDVQKQFHSLDLSKDGRVQKEEFVKSYLDHFKTDNEQQFYDRMHFTKKFLKRKPKLATVFDTFDSDHNGFLDRGEIYRMVKLSKPRFTNDELNELFKKMDTDHDHKVSKTEFVLYYFHLFFNESDADFEQRVEEAFQGRRRVKLQVVFNAYDLDANGFLDLNEFSLMLKMNGRKFVSAEDILDTLVKIDRDHNRKVDFKEWSEYMNGLIAPMDDRQFNKAVHNMLGAARGDKKTAAAAPSVGPAAAPAKKAQ